MPFPSFIKKILNFNPQRSLVFWCAWITQQFELFIIGYEEENKTAPISGGGANLGIITSDGQIAALAKGYFLNIEFTVVKTFEYFMIVKSK